MSGTAGGWQQDIFTVLIVVAGQPGQGVFIYNGQPGPGNPPELSITNNTTDPFGNPVTPSLTLAGLPLLVYSGPPALGDLLVSIASTDSSDIFGNPYQTGMQVWGAAGANVEVTVVGGVPRIFFSTGVAEESAGASSAVIIAQLQNPGPSEIINWFLTGPRISVGGGSVITPGNLSSLLENSGGGPYSVTWPTNPTAGQKVFIWCWTSSSTTVTNAVDNGTSPTTYTVDFVDTNTAGQHLYLFRADNITLPASGAYTVTLTAVGTTSVVAGGKAMSGIKPGGPTATGPGTGTGTAVSTGAATPGFAGAYATAAFTTDLFVSSTIGAAGGGFTNQFNQPNGTGFAPGASADQVVAGGPSAETCTWTVGNSAAWVAGVAVYDAIQASPGSYVYAQMNGEAKDGSAPALGALVYVDSSSVTHDLLEWGANGVQVQTMIPGDATVYQTEELRLTLTGDIPITSSTLYVAVVQTPNNLGTGTYEFEGMLKIQPTANNGKINIIFVGGSMVNTMLAECWEMVEGAPATLGNNGGLIALGGAGFTGSAMATGIGRTLYVRGTMIVTTAGVFGIDAINAVAAGDTFTIKQLGSYLNIKPVTSV
jgi:hypothetical protein